MHMAINPADQAYENNKNEIEKLQAEVGGNLHIFFCEEICAVLTDCPV